MVEIEQEELERLKEIETKYGELQNAHADLNDRHNKLKDDYIELSKGQQQGSDNKEVDEFEELCKSKFKK